MKNHGVPMLSYASLFLLCSLFDVVSHALKESIVRSQPLNQEKFNFNISVAQFVVGIMITPAILSISKEYENYDGAGFDPKQMHLWEFIGTYFSRGFSCLLETKDVGSGENNEHCKFSFLYLMGYVFALFLLQVTLTYVSKSLSVSNCSVWTADASKED